MSLKDEHLAGALQGQRGSPGGVAGCLNRSSGGGAATIIADDDSETRYETLRLTLGGGEAVHFNSDDLEIGNRAKGLTGNGAS